LYQSLSQDERYFAGLRRRGENALRDGRISEAAEALSVFSKETPVRRAMRRRVGAIRLDSRITRKRYVFSPPSGDFPGATATRHLSDQPRLIGGWQPATEEKLKEIKDPPAQLAAQLAVALAECRLRQNDAADAERIMEAFIEENSRLPGLPDAFEALDRIYARGGAASSAELRRWAADSRNGQRAALALFYLARNEARASKSEKSRQFFTDFLAQYPSHFLANEARAELSASQSRQPRPGGASDGAIR
jgi:hypothetical protein